MTEAIVSGKKSVGIGSTIATAGRLSRAVKVKVQDEVAFDPVRGLPYTQEERMADIREAEENYAMGQTTTSEELKKRIAEW